MRVWALHLWMSRSWREAVFVLALGLVLVAPVRAEEPTRDDLPWLRRWSPPLRPEMDDLPPFFRDTHLNLHLRTFYLNRTTTNGTAAEVLATGGWIHYQSGWLLDTFTVGAVGYLSELLYALRDRDGTLLLEPGQQGYAVLGQAWAALRNKDYALLKGPGSWWTRATSTPMTAG